ncbi:MAG: type I restriction enzyme HsdR N-terminal domain-containing protein [Ferruginibacter sp.]
MIKIIYPAKKPSIKNADGKEQIFCIIRKRWILITPEEWVRQNFLLYLTEVLNYPASLIAVEKQLMLGDVKKRFDIVVYDKETKPLMIIECKEMNVALSENTLQQVLRYNINVKAKYLVVTNGSYCAAFRHDKGSYIIEDKIPLPGVS